jgi:hypothetical protein
MMVIRGSEESPSDGQEDCLCVSKLLTNVFIGGRPHRQPRVRSEHWLVLCV